jgi:membrane-associated phospholipid phosphatase
MCETLPISALQFTDERRPWVRAALFSAALSLLFILVYGGSNALASQRADVSGYFFSWELRIPFVPALIVPYMSIDLFFVASFLLCANNVELGAHARRVGLAILIAGVAFLMFPLTAGYPRPDVSGWTGWLFEFLWSFDKPHNLVPSLHVALASLLWPVYARHTHGALRWLVHGWFTLIIASPLLTWQHHLLDVVTGAMLGQLCTYAFPDARDRQRLGTPDPRRNLTVNHSAAAHLATDWHENSLARSSPNLRVARFYAAGSGAFAILAIALGPRFWLLLWPALSLALISIAYVRGNSDVFRKVNGRLPISTRVVLGPYLLGTFARLLIYRQRCEPWVELAPGVYCGRLLTKREASAMREIGVTGVLDMTAEHAETRTLLEIGYLNVPVLDLTEASPEQLEVAVAFITEHARRGGVYAHCALGVSRSVSAIAAYSASQQTEPGPSVVWMS